MIEYMWTGGVGGAYGVQCIDQAPQRKQQDSSPQ